MGIPDNWNAPIVGERVGVCLNAATRSSRSGKWIWERSDNGDTWETISGITAPTYEYTPTTSDLNHYLRAKVALSGGGFAYTRAPRRPRQERKRRDRRLGDNLLQQRQRKPARGRADNSQRP